MLAPMTRYVRNCRHLFHLARKYQVTHSVWGNVTLLNVVPHLLNASVDKVVSEIIYQVINTLIY